MRLFEGKVVLVTGGTGAAGQAATAAFLAEGATVAQVWNRSPAQKHEKIIPVQADASRTESMTRAVTEVLGAAGQIDAVVNLVGGYAGGRLADTNDDTWNRMLSLNLNTAFIVTRAVLPHMLARRTGRIVHVGSRASVSPFAGASAYIVSKAALGMLVRVAAEELGGSGISINAVLPRIIDTPENRRADPGADFSTWLPPASLARTLLWLAGESAGEISGALIPVG